MLHVVTVTFIQEVIFAVFRRNKMRAILLRPEVAILKEELIGCGFTQVMIRAVVEL